MNGRGRKGGGPELLVSSQTDTSETGIMKLETEKNTYSCFRVVVFALTLVTMKLAFELVEHFVCDGRQSRLVP